MPELGIICAKRSDTEALGRKLAAAVKDRNPGALLLEGDLGAGKTALASALVRSLPGGQNAETSSPSFTICNIYYTAPRVRHFDLYRLPPGLPNDELAEALDDAGSLTIVEWPQHMAALDAPKDGVLCRIRSGQNSDENTRLFSFTALGRTGEHFLDLLRTP